MLLRLTVQEVFLDDEDQYGLDEHGNRMFHGIALQSLLDEMRVKDGCVDVPVLHPLEELGVTVAADGPEVDLGSSWCDSGVRAEVLDDATIRVSLAKWRDRDPDRTYLVIGWRAELTPYEERLLGRRP